MLAVLAAASGGSVTSLEGITRQYEPLLRRGVAIPEERADDVHEYLHRQHLWERYRALKKGGPSQIAGGQLQVQDLWLADPGLPSASGAITDRVTDEPPQLAAALRLLRPENYTLTDRGNAMSVAAGDAVDALRSASLATNPFLLSPGARLFYLYVLLESDFDFIQAAYRMQLPVVGQRFTRMEFALRLDGACEGLRQEWSRRVRSGSDREQLKRLGELATKIQEVRDGKEQGKLDTWGGGRTPDQLATVRLEPLVDVGLLSRARFDYVYSVNESQLGFLTAMTAAASADAFLNASLCESYLRGTGLEPQRINDDQIWGRIKDAHTALRSSLGYASFKEVVVLAMARLADEGEGAFFELEDGVEVIKEQQRLQPRTVRLGIARGGGLTYVKIAEAGRSRDRA